MRGFCLASRRTALRCPLLLARVSCALWVLCGALRARRWAARFGGRDPNFFCTRASFSYERWYVECCERCARSSVVCLHVQSVQTHKKMLFEYSSLVAYRVGPSTTVGVRSVTAENLRESAATAKTIRCKTERPTTRPRTTSIQLTGQAKARQCADLSGAGTAVPRRACRGLARAAMGKHRLGKSKVSRSTVINREKRSEHVHESSEGLLHAWLGRSCDIGANFCVPFLENG